MQASGTIAACASPAGGAMASAGSGITAVCAQPSHTKQSPPASAAHVVHSHRVAFAWQPPKSWHGAFARRRFNLLLQFGQQNCMDASGGPGCLASPIRHPFPNCGLTSRCWLAPASMGEQPQRHSSSSCIIMIGEGQSCCLREPRRRLLVCAPPLDRELLEPSPSPLQRAVRVLVAASGCGGSALPVACDCGVAVLPLLHRLAPLAPALAPSSPWCEQRSA